jgi:nitroreductase
MCIFSQEENAVIDRVMGCRRSYRQFNPEVPEEDDIRRILHAGLLAPFAAAAVGNSTDYFRRFFVMRVGSKSLNAVSPLVFEQVRIMAVTLKKEMEKSPEIRKMAGLFSQRLDAIQKMGRVPGIGTAPYYIVVAERKGYPSVELQSLAHCMENMWLKATALGLGFQLVSISSEMSKNPEFCRILGINAGEWELMGCAIGYPHDELSPSIRPPVDDVTRWLE